MKRISQSFNPKNRRSVENLNQTLEFLLDNNEIFNAERDRKKITNSTRAAIHEIVPDIELPESGQLSPELIEQLNGRVIQKKYQVRENVTQLHKSLQVLGTKNFVKNVTLSSEEVRSQQIGPSTQAFIRSFQSKYKLPTTGNINAATEEKLESVITSIAGSKPRPQKLLKVKNPEQLTRTVHKLRLNMRSEKVQNLQKDLSWLGYEIQQAEHTSQVYGKTTQNAVKKLQADRGLPITGSVDSATAKVINTILAKVNPAIVKNSKFRVRGSVRDELWRGKPGIAVQVFEKGLRGTGALLGESRTQSNGFFDVLYTPPTDPKKKGVKSPLHLIVNFVDAQNQTLASKTYYKVKKVQWANVTEGSDRYQGTSEFVQFSKALSPHLLDAELTIDEIEQSNTQEDVAFLSRETGISTEAIMKLSLASRIANQVGQTDELPAVVFYAFLRLNQPPELPSDLFPDEPDEWDEWMVRLVDRLTNGIVFLETEIQADIIDDAFEQNYLSRVLKPRRDAIVDSLRSLRENYTLTKPILIGDGSLSTLLNISTVEPERHTLIGQTFIKYQSLSQPFWDDLEANTAIPSTEIANFKTSVDLGIITKNYSPLLQTLKTTVDDPAQPAVSSASGFAKLTREQWVGFIQSSGGTVPSNTDGDTESDRLNVYAATLKSQAEKLFPAVALVAEVARNSEHGLTHASEVSQLVDVLPDNSLKSVNLEKVNLDSGNLLSNDALQEAKLLQRINQITLSATAGTALLNEKLHSSAQIYFKGQDRLTERLSERGISRGEISRIYRYSENKYAHVLADISRFRVDITNFNPRAIPRFTYIPEEIEQFKQDIPSLERLFGTLDYCECQHCSSMYSPAAYLTDLLRFIEEKDAITPNTSVQDILLSRRPDIANIKLNCENTHTPLPYIDLVNEVLENAVPVASATPPTNSNFSHQSTLSAAELRAIPEHTRLEAYRLLRDATFPMTDAFHLWQEETRLFLQHLGVPRYDLMRTFQPKTTAGTDAVASVDSAAEYFTISSSEQVIILPPTPEDNAVKQADYWDIDVSRSSLSVAVFLEKTGLDYHQLLDLLQAKFVNPDTDKSEIERLIDDCDIDKQTVEALSLPKLDRIHRFVRLWRRTDWAMWELDLLIRNEKIGDGNLDGSCLRALQQFKQLQETLSLSVEELLSFYGPINTEIRFAASASTQPVLPLYHRLFLNIAVSNPINSQFELANLSGSNPLTDNLPTLLSALSITAESLALLLPAGAEVNLASLSLLYRYTALSKAMRLSVQDSMALLAVTGIADPFSSLSQTHRLIEYASNIRNAGFSTLQLNYILNVAPDSPIGLREETIVQHIELLRIRLKTLQNDVLNDNETPRDRLEKQLSKLPEFADTDLLVKALDLVEGTWPVEDEADRAPFIDETFGQWIPSAADPIGQLTTQNYFDDNQLSDTEEADIVRRYDFVFSHLYDYLNANLIKEQLASSLSFSSQIVDVVLTQLNLPGATISLLQQLQSKKLLQQDAAGAFAYDVSFTDFPELFQVYKLAHKISLLLSQFNLSADELGWYIDHASEVETLALANLPVETPPPNSLFPQWLNWWKLIAFQRQFPEPEGATFQSILEIGIDSAVDVTGLLSQLATLTQWNTSSLNRLHQALRLVHSDTRLDYAQADTYYRLQVCFEQIQRIGVDVDTLLLWASRSDKLQEERTAQALRQTAKSKYEVDEWLRKVRPIEDVLREKKRQALAAYLMERSRRDESKTIDVNGQTLLNPKYWNSNGDLFKYFLIDTQMSACQLTSRVKQATSSVQLFVQRCFLNLENRYVNVPKADPDLDNSWKQWTWMKNYRIWEANRKVFFYPENWIEPELRDDKSPFFEELENEILQNEITHENVEPAFLSYLQKVDEVAHLDIVGMCHDTSTEVDIVHVIGRSPSSPHRYYHRTYDLDYSLWTAWEKIEIDITGEHLVPTVYNRKLHLFWLTFEEKPEQIKKNPGAKGSLSNNASGSSFKLDSSQNPEPAKILEIQLAWTVKSHKGWIPKATSDKKLIHPWQRPDYVYHLNPRYQSSSNTLWIDIFLSTSKEFNNGLFYDQYSEQKTHKTRHRYRETIRPWHSSSFVFNGDVLALKLRGLTASYYLPKEDKIKRISSVQYVKENFGVAGRNIERLDSADQMDRLLSPPGIHFEYNYQTNNRDHNANSTTLRFKPPSASAKTLLKNTKSPFKLITPMRTKTVLPFVYQDDTRAFFVKSEWKQILIDYQTRERISRYVFYPLYHPYTALFIRELNRSGLDGLLNRKIQVQPEALFPRNDFRFSRYQPQSPHEPDDTAAQDTVDFSFGGAYSVYNWEIFFHGPMLIAGKLSQNQRFEEAMAWYHYIFDPTSTDNHPIPQRYWITKPFFEHSEPDYRQQRIQNIIDKIDEFREPVTAWKNNPFKPHLIARYRPVAYQRNVVMKYLDNIIAWGDQLFRRDTLESTNEAALLYMLAYELLGDRPQSVPSTLRGDKTFRELLAEGDLDVLGNTKVEVIAENELSLPIRVVRSISRSQPLPRLETLYFCIPHNQKLMGYWDTVEDRLFKLRHCMNIEGIVRQLPLFAPPIDPALLVKAAAAGVDLGSVLNDLSVPMPNYRFRTLLQSASKFCAEVTALGQKLLTALESKDSEGLALLRSSQEIKLLEAVKAVRILQVDESNEMVAGLFASKDVIAKRIEYYGGIPRMNREEGSAVDLHVGAIYSEVIATVLNTAAGTAHLIPKVEVGAEGFGGSPRVTVKYGGDNVGKSSMNFAALFGGLATILHSSASLLETQGGYTRRDNETTFQKELAEKDQIQIERQIAAANIRVSISEEELKNHELQVENAQRETDYLQTKYTHQQLYSWMITQLSSVYFQAYQLAYDMAKRAEKSFRYELGLQTSDFVQFGYWDGLKKGLLAGDKLMHDLYRMEAAYYDQHKRELELTKHVSLAQVAPQCLLELKTTGVCRLELPEWLFDMDFLGHYLRRIKAISVTIPCVTGPYTGVHCTLSLHSSRIRVSSLVGSSYAMVDENDDRFTHEFGSIHSIATSHGQNDTGLFELNFSDERFLPFEGAGVDSTWGIKMPQANNQFDFSTIADFIIHIQYTAKEGGENLAIAAQSHLNATLPSKGLLLLDIKRQFPTEWHRFLHPDQTNADQTLQLTLNAEHYPFYARGKQVNVTQIKLLLGSNHSGEYSAQLTLPSQPASESFQISKDAQFNGLHYKEHDLPSKPGGQGNWMLQLKHSSDQDFQSLPTDSIEEIFLLIHFETSA